MLGDMTKHDSKEDTRIMNDSLQASSTQDPPREIFIQTHLYDYSSRTNQTTTNIDRPLSFILSVMIPYLRLQSYPERYSLIKIEQWVRL